MAIIIKWCCFSYIGDVFKLYNRLYFTYIDHTCNSIVINLKYNIINGKKPLILMMQFTSTLSRHLVHIYDIDDCSMFQLISHKFVHVTHASYKS